MSILDSTILHRHVLEKLEAADLMLGHTAEVKLDEVYTADMITPEWLSKAIGGEVPRAKIEKITSAGGHEGMTRRDKLSLVWNQEGQDAGLPKAIFIKATPTDVHLRETLSLLHMAELESHVYNDLGKELTGLIPKCFYARSFPGGRFIIILEDMDEQGMTPHWMGDTVTIPLARGVAVTFAKIHAKYWNSSRFEGDMVWVRPRCRRFGENWLRNQFDINRKKFLESELGKSTPEYTQNLIRQWIKSSDKVYEYWDTKPPTIVHGDSHLGNVLEFPDGSAGIYDWQCLFRGYGYRDLSYFLMSAFTVEDCHGHEREIFDLYTDTLEANGVKVDREEAWLDYCLLGLERFDSAMTSLNRGGYGHARHAFERQVATLSVVLEEHDVANLLDRVVKTGSIKPS
jgi:hypothetical protein